MATPKVTRQLFNNNLTRASEAASGPTNRRVIILGNATDGPLNTPVKVSSPADAAEKFGLFGKESYNLTKGLKECFDAQAGGTAAPDVYGMRVVGYNNTDPSAVTAVAASRIWTHGTNNTFQLEATIVGTFYNDISVWADATDLHIYDPVTDTTVDIAYTAGTTTMGDLKDAINNDATLSAVMTATNNIVDTNDGIVSQTVFGGSVSVPEYLLGGYNGDIVPVESLAVAASNTWQDGSNNDVFKLEAVYPGKFYNDISIKSDSADLHIYNPKTKLTTKIAFAGIDLTMKQLADTINTHISLNEVMFATPINEDEIADSGIFPAAEQKLEGGDDWNMTDILGGLTIEDQLYLGLDNAYDNFISDFFDVMAVVDLTLDATVNDADGLPTSFATQMSDFLNNFNGEMIGVTSFEAITGTGVGGRVLRDDVTSRLNSVLSDAVVAGMDQPFMFCVDGEGIFTGQSSKYPGNLNCAVAGLIAAMPTEEAIYRHNLPGVNGLVWSYGGKDASSGSLQVDLLSDARISVPQVRNGEIKLSESRSLAKPGSDYENLMTVLILQEALEICRNVAKDFIGKVSSAELLQAFQTNLDSQLGSSLVPRVLRGFKAPVVMTPGERVVGRVTIPLVLQPQFELRDVHYNVELSAEDLA